MHPKLFEIPFVNLTVWSYGVMMVIGFISAVYLIRRLSRNITGDPQMITNAALYSLIAGIVGARLFYIIHYFDNFKGDILSIFAIWEGGLELLGGVISAITVIILYLRYHKLPIRRYLDILAVALLLALSFGRIGCFLRGCCFGKPTGLPWAIRFPYASDAYRSQIYPDQQRNRPEPRLKLPGDFFGLAEENGLWYRELKPIEDLTDDQKLLVKPPGPYSCLLIHPTQLYSSANGVFLCFLLYLFRRRGLKAERLQNTKKFLIKPGCTFALMFILYGSTRFLIEFLRDDNPFEFDSLTVSQNLGIAMVILGVIMMVIFEKVRPDSIKLPTGK